MLFRYNKNEEWLDSFDTDKYYSFINDKLHFTFNNKVYKLKKDIDFNDFYDNSQEQFDKIEYIDTIENYFK